jgi:hypothetical protein
LRHHARRLSTPIRRSPEKADETEKTATMTTRARRILSLAQKAQKAASPDALTREDIEHGNAPNRKLKSDLVTALRATTSR